MSEDDVYRSKHWQKAKEEHEVARIEFSDHLDELEKLCKRERRDSWSPLEQDVTHLFLAQLLYKRFKLFKIEGELPPDEHGQPRETIQDVLEGIKSCEEKARLMKKGIFV